MDFSTAARTPHPRLIIRDLDELTLRAGLDHLTRAVYAGVKKDADALLTSAPARYVREDGVRLLAVSREVVRRTY